MIHIIADTTSCLPATIQAEFNIPIAPQMIHFGETSYTEGKDLDTDIFLELLQSADTLPKTSAPPPELFREIYSQFNLSEQTLICIHPSADLSGTIRSAQTAKLDFPEADIRILDTRLVASPLGSVVHQAALLAAEGKTASEICAQVHHLSSRCRIYFVVSTLEYLAKGGRIGGASALLGNALQIKPILTLKDGKVEQFAKERTFKRAVEHIKSLVCEEYPTDQAGYLSIMHAGNPDLAQALSSFFVEELDIDPPLISYLPPAIITHAGPGSIAVGFFQ